jgi:copper chaperone NosL
MKSVLVVLFALVMVSCNRTPEPLVLGTDECSFCKMPMAEIKFGAEIITTKGKIYKFDDIGCMSKFLKTVFNKSEKVQSVLVVNYTDNKKFITAHESLFLKSDALHSPMNSGIAAFDSRQKAESFLSSYPGEIMSWEQVQKR